ncbi:hypothetical protein LTR16_003385 [Cryomyces antarcticus]|uniref:HhH-GPD domain-containing protein n=1 Tax=Cryomyces antarcticus TaxID=329879 RepID=A0ABR0M6V1_9PEZI|nr:hypothetical protein LTR39_005338 [Cryomyces antarcticus]KAK5288295.1 hypothetical protein LTR16_003385 [Cryomyces antarcticus]
MDQKQLAEIDGPRYITRRVTRSLTVLPAEQRQQSDPSTDSEPTRKPRIGQKRLHSESIAHNLYFLVVQAILWNQTHGKQARPVFLALIERYPDPKSLSKASLEELTELLRPLGLHNIRASRCIALGICWDKDPPTPGRQHRRKGYPRTSLAASADDAYEIGHLPGVGPYALDSFRIFHRDEMRGLAKDWLGTGATDEDFEPEWKRVIPLDKELRAYLKWRWLKEGFIWNEENGNLTAADEELLAVAARPSDER